MNTGLEDFKVCHCASEDCTNCPMRDTGTGSLEWIQRQRQKRKGHENADQNITIAEEVQQESLRQLFHGVQKSLQPLHDSQMQTVE